MSVPLPGVQVDDTMAGYADDSRHRQKIDMARVVDAVGNELGFAEKIVDLGCGVGDLIDVLATRATPGASLLGVEASAQRVQACTARFADDPRCRFLAGDLLEALPFGDADVVTMTAVLHWLHPHEGLVLGSVAERLSSTGVFALTTYHPEPEIAGLGGTDSVVAAALATSDDDVLHRFAAARVTPVSHRTLRAEQLAAMAARHFRQVERSFDVARTAPPSGRDFANYFESTFGDYYRPLFRSTTDMRARIAAVADERLARLGHVTSMTVATWALRAPAVHPR